jgi:hypothetical protein
MRSSPQPTDSLEGRAIAASAAREQRTIAPTIKIRSAQLEKLACRRSGPTEVIAVGPMGLMRPEGLDKI